MAFRVFVKPLSTAPGFFNRRFLKDNIVEIPCQKQEIYAIESSPFLREKGRRKSRPFYFLLLVSDDIPELHSGRRTVIDPGDPDPARGISAALVSGSIDDVSVSDINRTVTNAAVLCIMWIEQHISGFQLGTFDCLSAVRTTPGRCAGRYHNTGVPECSPCEGGAIDTICKGIAAHFESGSHVRKSVLADLDPLTVLFGICTQAECFGINNTEFHFFE